MTTLEIIKLVAKIQVGTRLQAGNSIIVITEVTDKMFKGQNEYAKAKGFISETVIPFEYFANPHYNKNYKVLN